MKFKVRGLPGMLAAAVSCVVAVGLPSAVSAHVPEVAGREEGVPSVEWHPGTVSWWGHSGSARGAHWRTVGYDVSPMPVGENYDLNDVRSTGRYQTFMDDSWSTQNFECVGNSSDTIYSFNTAALVQTAVNHDWISTGSPSVTLWMNPIIRGFSDRHDTVAVDAITNIGEWQGFADAFGFRPNDYRKYYNKSFTIEIPGTTVHLEYRDAKSGQLMSRLGCNFQSGNSFSWDDPASCQQSYYSNQDVTFPQKKSLIRSSSGKLYALVGAEVYDVPISIGFDGNRIMPLYDGNGVYLNHDKFGVLGYNAFVFMGDADRREGMVVADRAYNMAKNGALAQGAFSRKLVSGQLSYDNFFYEMIKNDSFRTATNYQSTGAGLVCGSNTWVEYFYAEIRPSFKLFWNKKFEYTDAEGVAHQRATATEALTYDEYSQRFKGHANEDPTGYNTQSFLGERGVSDNSGFSNRYYVYGAAMKQKNSNAAWVGNGNQYPGDQSVLYSVGENEYYGTKTYDSKTVTCPVCGARVAPWHVAKCGSFDMLKSNAHLQVCYRVRPPQIELSYVKQDDGTYRLWQKSSRGRVLGDAYGLTDFAFRKSGDEASAAFPFQRVAPEDPYCVYNLRSLQVYRLAGQNSVKYYNGDRDDWVDGTASVQPTNSVTAEFGYTGGSAGSSGGKKVTSLEIDLAKYKENAGQVLRAKAVVDARPIVFVGVYEQQPVLEVRSYYYYDTVNGKTTLNFSVDTPQNNQKLLNASNGVYKELLPAEWNGRSYPASIPYSADGSSKGIPLYKLDGAGDDLTIAYASGDVGLKLLKMGQRVSPVESPPTVALGALRGWCPSWQDDAIWKMKIHNYNVLVKAYGPKTPDLTVAKYFNPEYPLSGHEVPYELMEEARSFFVSFGFNGLLPYTFAEKVYYTYQKEELATTLANTGTTKVPLADMVNYRPVLPKTILDLEKNPHGAAGNPSWLPHIQWSKTDPDSGELPTNPVSTQIDPSRPEDSATPLFLGVYKADKAYTKIAYVRKVDGSYAKVDDAEVSPLNVNTRKIRVGFREYLEYEGELYQLVNVGDNAVVSQDWRVPNLPFTAKKLAGFTWKVGGDTEKGILNAPSEYSVLHDADGSTHGADTLQDSISPLVGNNEEHTVYQKKLVVCGVYARVGKEGGQDPFNTEDEYQPFSHFAPEASGTDSAACKLLPTASAFQSVIENDAEFSSDEFDVKQSIPSSEFVKAHAAVPKYLVNGAFAKRTECLTIHHPHYSNVTVFFAIEKTMRNVIL